MEKVSDEWLINQKSITQKQGYCIIEITDYAESSSPSTTIISSLDKNNDIKKVVHKRSYDPVCIEMPTNNVTIELYNYNDKYINFYRDYSGRTIEVVVKYGFCLSTNETIQGGKFYVNNVKLDSENVIQITAVSSLELEENNIDMVYNEIDDSDVVVFEDSNGKRRVEYDEMYIHNLPEMSYLNIVNKISTATGIDFLMSEDFSGQTIVLPGDISFNTIDIIAYLANMEQMNVKIGRNGEIIINHDADFFYKNKIIRLNIMKKPSYNQTKKIKAIDISAPVYDLTGKIITTTYQVNSETVSFCELDYSMCEIDNFSCSSNMQKITRMIQRGKRGYEIEHGGAHVNVSMFIRYRKLSSDMQKTTAIYSDYGEVCDITNKIGAPVNTDRIKNYFSNRDLYDITMRGDPARDVGDYVFFEIEKDNFQKALIISDELTFTGSFSEKATVRMIKNDFETVDVDTSEIKTGLFKYTEDGKKDLLSGYSDFRGTAGGRYL